MAAGGLQYSSEGLLIYSAASIVVLQAASRQVGFFSGRSSLSPSPLPPLHSRSHSFALSFAFALARSLSPPHAPPLNHTPIYPSVSISRRAQVPHHSHGRRRRWPPRGNRSDPRTLHSRLAALLLRGVRRAPKPLAVAPLFPPRCALFFPLVAPSGCPPREGPCSSQL